MSDLTFLTARKRNSLGVAFFVVLFSLLMVVADAAAPAWWYQRGIIAPAKPEDDFATINQGQLKNLVSAAVDEMNARLTGGAGSGLNQMVNLWSANSANADDFAVANIGQVKALAKPVYDRLLDAGQITALPPWLTTQSLAIDDFAAANIGQAKYAFSFEIPLTFVPGGDPGSIPGGSAPLPGDADGDGISDLDEARFGLGSNDNDQATSPSAQAFFPDAAGRLQSVSKKAPHGYSLDAEGNISSVNP